MSDCIFCKIIDGSIPSSKVFESEHVLAFRDISPMAPTHVLVIPKRHIQNILELAQEPSDLYRHLLHGIEEVVKETGLAEKGFRVLTNTGEEGQQTVDHLHFHVVGGRQLKWEM